ncbi:hypothetical protein HYH02_010131 [Chlamydomonas schloesseri]|uniref:SRCR domain-containing protein n=1 Tax=Chlamydomonas schloesseri TaxID=2026947 RepID=A0A835W4R4_9CHLO|nr:hypothetical protein HYH02_010131 [Chlamydomonas schloesseri]|eukprot:KAG2440547.1 hypothetical protein HYH02_010131 [Chlamydomonas schloesseri]
MRSSQVTRHALLLSALLALTTRLCLGQATTGATQGSAAKPALEKYSLRLMDGKTPNEGRLEMWDGDMWGTVCDDGFGVEEATVACRELGYARGEAVVAWGGGKGPIMMDDVVCYPDTHKRLHECLKTADQNCFHTEDVGLRCFEAEAAPAAVSSPPPPPASPPPPPPPSPSAVQQQEVVQQPKQEQTPVVVVGAAVEEAPVTTSTTTIAKDVMMGGLDRAAGSDLPLSGGPRHPQGGLHGPAVIGVAVAVGVAAVALAALVVVMVVSTMRRRAAQTKNEKELLEQELAEHKV